MSKRILRFIEVVWFVCLAYRRSRSATDLGRADDRPLGNLSYRWKTLTRRQRPRDREHLVVVTLFVYSLSFSEVSPSFVVVFSSITDKAYSYFINGRSIVLVVYLCYPGLVPLSSLPSIYLPSHVFHFVQLHVVCNIITKMACCCTDGERRAKSRIPHT